MDCPYKTPVRVIETNGTIVDADDEIALKVMFSHRAFNLQIQQLHYAAESINSHEKLVDIANDLESGLKYLRDTKTKLYGFGIDRLEEKLEALKEAGDPK